MQIRSKLLHLHAAFVYSFDFEVEKLGSHKAKLEAEVDNLEKQFCIKLCSDRQEVQI